jgi:hypothetical protein
MTSGSIATGWVAAPSGRLLLIDLLRHARRVAPRSRPDVPLNDNLQGFRGPTRQRLTPLLACYWYLAENRLRWLAAVNDEAPTDDLQGRRQRR